MIIDDSPTIRKILEISLGREGFAVKSFPDGVEALRSLMESHARIPDLVFLDIELPRMNGYEVARRLKATPPLRHTVIILLSRRDGVMERLKGRLVGAAGYLTKPCRTQEILALTRSSLGMTAESEKEVVSQ